MAVVAAILAAVAVAAPAGGDPDVNALEPGRPRPNPSAEADAAYIAYLQQNGFTITEKSAFLYPSIGIGICNSLNEDMDYNVLMQQTRDSAMRHYEILGAVQFYCPWNKDRIPAYVSG